MATWATDFEVEIQRVMILVRRDRKQRWIYRENGVTHVSETPVPYKDKISVFWMPTVQAVACNYSPRMLAHPAI